MTAPAPLRGIWPALLIPLNDALDIDHARLVAHARRLLDAGCAGVTPFGTTGEGMSFSVAERIAGVEALVEGGVPASRILVSTSCAALPDVLALTRHARKIGAWGCLMLPPFYFKGVGDAGIVDAYCWLIDRTSDRTSDRANERAGGGSDYPGGRTLDGAAATPLRLMLYHLPQVAGVGLSHGVIAELARRYPQTIVGIKDSAGDLAHSLALADVFMPKLGVHVGHEPDLPALGHRGSTGAVSGLANFMPRLVQRLLAAGGAADDLARVGRLLEGLRGLSLIPALKAVMAAHDGDAAWLRVRPPLVAQGTAEQQATARLLASLALDPARD